MSKLVLTVTAAAVACCAGAITVQNVPSTVRSADGTLVVNTAQPKYSMTEAIELCIRELEQRGEKVTTGAVKNRLQRMSKSDVDLNVDGLSRTIREVVEAYDARKAKDLPAPDPAKYNKREKFIAAYLDWKAKSLTPAEKREQHSRMGAEAKFRREAKEEAEGVWEKRLEAKPQDGAARKSQDSESDKPQAGESEKGKETSK